ncbi:MAG TPA: dihydroorotate dehydrogenase catalytic subunit, partial [Treponema sp.]|nr:dihydroorotate dehydrogenase catalytic subunit [Treponema sp.]
VFTNPHVAKDITEGLSAFMKRKGYNSIEDFKGIAHAL